MTLGTRIGIGAAICALLPFAFGEWAHRRAVAAREAPMLVWSHGDKRGTEPPATVELTPERITISVLREGMHPFLAEYERRLVLQAVGKKDLVFPLLPDTGGTVRINLYRLRSGAVLLLDRIGAYHINLTAFTVKEAAQEGPPAGATFLGSFDQLGTTWQFIGVEKRKELPL